MSKININKTISRRRTKSGRMRLFQGNCVKRAHNVICAHFENPLNPGKVQEPRQHRAHGAGPDKSCTRRARARVDVYNVSRGLQQYSYTIALFDVYICTVIPSASVMHRSLFLFYYYLNLTRATKQSLCPNTEERVKAQSYRLCLFLMSGSNKSFLLLCE